EGDMAKAQDAGIAGEDAEADDRDQVDEEQGVGALQGRAGQELEQHGQRDQRQAQDENAAQRDARAVGGRHHRSSANWSKVFCACSTLSMRFGTALPSWRITSLTRRLSRALVAAAGGTGRARQCTQFTPSRV